MALDITKFAKYTLKYEKNDDDDGKTTKTGVRTTRENGRGAFMHIFSGENIIFTENAYIMPYFPSFYPLRFLFSTGLAAIYTGSE